MSLTSENDDLFRKAEKKKKEKFCKEIRVAGLLGICFFVEQFYA